MSNVHFLITIEMQELIMDWMYSYNGRSNKYIENYVGEISR
jgi:hypothetical protein